MRAFSNQAVPLDVLQRVIDKARFTPSGCDFQPREATILIGEPLAALEAMVQVTAPENPVEYIIQPPDIGDEYMAHLAENGSTPPKALLVRMRIGAGHLSC